MAERELDNRLEELRKQNIQIYSISRIDAINHCLHGAYHTYVLDKRGIGNVYSCAGSVTHDCLEDIMNNKKTELDLLPAIQEELENLDMLGIEFPKDRNGGDSIRQGWIDDMTHFATTYKKPNGKFETEQLFIYKTKGGNYLQGYIDLTRINKDGSIDIYDYKTSSMYTGEAIKEHGRQLLLYAMGKMQEGLKVNSISWIMLKYAEIRFLGKKTAKSKNKTEISKVVERRKIGKEISKYVEQDLYEIGYDEIDAEIILGELKKTNMFDCLPEEIRDNYKMLPYVMKYEITQELIDECEEYIDSTIEKWEKMDSSDISQYTPRNFTKIQKNGKEVRDDFFCINLCDHFKDCTYIHDHLLMLENQSSDDEDLF